MDVVMHEFLMQNQHWVHIIHMKFHQIYPKMIENLCTKSSPFSLTKNKMEEFTFMEIEGVTYKVKVNARTFTFE